MRARHLPLRPRSSVQHGHRLLPRLGLHSRPPHAREARWPPQPRAREAAARAEPARSPRARVAARRRVRAWPPRAREAVAGGLSRARGRGVYK